LGGVLADAPLAGDALVDKRRAIFGKQGELAGEGGMEYVDPSGLSFDV
jgi:hypothetical protein